MAASNKSVRIKRTPDYSKLAYSVDSLSRPKIIFAITVQNKWVYCKTLSFIADAFKLKYGLDSANKEDMEKTIQGNISIYAKLQMAQYL